ncbi:hypothetical protein OD91_1452 [Lutibacter sp. Hel_I_33_5]|uniref:tetratricopeptide repeat protein n=1 Tax=Lutibacter sp. Hel_I_33_5 TaxID=1566289 RepID=UPI00119CF1C2|nr:hypothetical protein [Lutibacter sp. Hel_I_33_5]TVZ56172.1 hypothetical protein OD91_1452 [Lutibacter sp. Hel_I_33_5]
MIIQNLHKNFIEKRKERRESSLLLKAVLSFFFLLSSFFFFAQDSIPTVVDLSEKKNLEFQDYFFKALSEKAINNHQKAIENLDNCNEIIPNNKAVLFELSKNYFKLNKNFEALEFANKSLEKDSENIWLLEHLVAIHKKGRNFNDAIRVQKKIALKHPKKKQQLVFLYLMNSNHVDAKKILNELEDSKMLTSRLRRIKENLNRSNNQPKTEIVKKENTVKTLASLESQFKSDKNYSLLKQLLEKSFIENKQVLLKYSQEGLELFPAQPYVYLMNGSALNNKKSHQKALDVLQNGIDFVIDDTNLEAKFYLEIANAYKGLGNKIEENKFKNKAKKLIK